MAASPLLRYLSLALVITAGAGAMVLVEREHLSTEASPQALLTAAADVQQEATRLPARFDRMPDADENHRRQCDG